MNLILLILQSNSTLHDYEVLGLEVQFNWVCYASSGSISALLTKNTDVAIFVPK